MIGSEKIDPRKFGWVDEDQWNLCLVQTTALPTEISTNNLCAISYNHSSDQTEFLKKKNFEKLKYTRWQNYKKVKRILKK